jgi:hypothetical protein
MHLAPLGRRGVSVHSRAHERVTKHDALAQLEQAIRLGGHRSLNAEGELLGRSPQESRVAHRVRGREQQQPPRLGR